jgi:polynucleotide 5'-kinase involved in rRNA processing
MKMSSDIHIPLQWQAIEIEKLSGTLMVMGSSDSGKSTFAQWLVNSLCRHHDRVGWIDGDIGQATLGIPTTMNLATVDKASKRLPQPEATFFVGNTSPRDHMLPTLVGLLRLRDRAVSLGATVVIIDTTGFVTRQTGGRYLKYWKIKVLCPEVIFALQRGDEMDHILRPLKKDSSHHLHVLPVAETVRSRSSERRASHRRTLFRRYFQSATTQIIHYSDRPVYWADIAGRFSLIALQDREGFCLALGVLLKMSEDIMEIVTPLSNVSKVESLCIGSLHLDPATGIEI